MQQAQQQTLHWMQFSLRGTFLLRERMFLQVLTFQFVSCLSASFMTLQLRDFQCCSLDISADLVKRGLRSRVMQPSQSNMMMLGSLDSRYRFLMRLQMKPNSPGNSFDITPSYSYCQQSDYRQRNFSGVSSRQFLKTSMYFFTHSAQNTCWHFSSTRFLLYVWARQTRHSGLTSIPAYFNDIIMIQKSPNGIKSGMQVQVHIRIII